jgi:hypothetical protein
MQTNRFPAKEKFSTDASTSQSETSNIRAMKKTLHSLAAIVCLLTLLLSATTCAHGEQPKQSACSHCPKRAPLSHSLPSCCSAQQQLPAVISAVVEHRAQPVPVLISLLPDEVAPLRTPPVARLTASPPQPPLISLRI